MTVRQVYEYVLIELNKAQAPHLLLEDFNYIGNKGIGMYVNKGYNLYDINQQKTDDLRVLKSTAILEPTKTNSYPALTDFLENTYEVYLPDDYLHILNCVVEYSLARNYQCYRSGQKVHYGAKRMTADMFPQLFNNHYMKPKYNNPYFYINNVALDTIYPISESPINVYSNLNISSFLLNFTGFVGPSTVRIIKEGVTYDFVYSSFQVGEFFFSSMASFQEKIANIGITSEVDTTSLLLGNVFIEGVTSVQTIVGSYPQIFPTMSTNNAFVNKLAGYRYGNKSRVKLEVRYGNNDSTFVLTRIYVDYLRSPQFIQLTQDQIDSVDDISQVLEFPDYVCQEIVNELVKLIMENASDPRLQTNIPVNQSISGGQQTK
jgi:hypothetical protein